MNLYALAEKLHKTYDEVEQISVSEYHGWLVYFKIKSKEVDNGSSNVNQNSSTRRN